jgi:ABC-2 type transport system ATP-binding protein
LAVQGIEVQGLVKSYGAVRALDGVDLRVPPGTLTALVGKNGAGKSTLIRVLATTILPDEGTVMVGGCDVREHPERARRETGVFFGDERSFYWRLSGRENLRFFAALKGIRRRDVDRAVTAALASVDLVDVGDRRVDRYSSGMRARLGLARALLGRPSVLLLDEPTKSLDPVTAADIRAHVARIRSEDNIAVLFATHDLHEAASLADENVILANGRVAAVLPGGGETSTLERVLIEANR